MNWRKSPELSWLVPAMGIVIVFAGYWPGRGGGFIFDDIANIVGNPHLRVNSLAWQDWVVAAFSSPSGPIQRPLAMLSFALNYYFTGMEAMPMKLTNIGIHALNFTLLLGLTAALFRTAMPHLQPCRARLAGAFVALTWALHPVNVMAVLYVVQRMESLAHTFVFLGLWIYVIGRQRQLQGKNGWAHVLVGVCGCTAVGAGAKESALLLPLYAACLEIVVFRFRLAGTVADRRVLGLYLVVLVLPAMAGLRLILPDALDPGSYTIRNFNMVERLLTEGRVVMDYLSWTLLPDLGQLSLFHDDYRISRSLFSPPTTALAFVAIGALLVAAAMLRDRRPIVALGILWFFAAHAMTATIVPLELVFEHRNYFASAGVLLCLADLLLTWPGPERVRFGALLAALFLVFCGTLTHLRAREWRDPVTFAVTEASKHPQSPRASYLLASTLVKLSDYRADSPSAVPAWRALERARLVSTRSMLPLQATLIFAARSGAPQQDSWWDDLEAKARTLPLTSENRLSLIAINDCAVEGVCEFPRNRMIAVYSAVLARGPDAGMLSVYGKYALHVLKDYPLALRLWRDSVARDEGKAQYRVNLAALCIALGRFDEARTQIAALRRLGVLDQHAGLADSLAADLLREQARRNAGSGVQRR